MCYPAREAHYHSIFFAALSSVGVEIIPESRTDNRRRQGYGGQEGRTDAVLKTDAAIYVIEFKLGTPEEALAQIKAKRYYEPYLADHRPVVLLAAGGFAERTVRCLWEEQTADRRP